MARATTVRWLLAATGTAVLLGGLPASAGSGTTSADVPVRRDVTATVIRTSTADAPVQVNVDIGLQVARGRRCTSGLPGVCNGGGRAVYHPCFNLHDKAYKACQLYTLFRVLDPEMRWDLAQGIAIGNTSTARDGSTVAHDWARKVTQVDLELYAFDPKGRYGDVRMRVPSFPTEVLGTAYSDRIGHIHLPKAGDPDVGRLVGRAIGKDGRPMPPSSFKLDAFGHSNTGHPTGLLEGRRFTVYGFGGAKVQPGVRNGSYRTKPLWAGAYDIHVQRKGASFVCGFDVVPGKDRRFDIDFRKPNLGNPRCEPMRSLAQGVPG